MENTCNTNLVNEMAERFTSIGMIVNLSKTEYIIFDKNHHHTKTLMVSDTKVTSKPSIQFDDNLTWATHINQTISKAKQGCHGLNHLRKFFNQEEMINIATALSYLRFYYGSTIRYGPMVHKQYKKRLKAASTNIIK